MSRSNAIRLLPLLGALGLAVVVSGCGKQGLLQEPPPLFGERAKARYEDQQRQRAQDATDRAVRRTGNSTAEADKPDDAPITTRDIKAPEQRNTPASSSPLDGVPNPLGSPISPRAPG